MKLIYQFTFVFLIFGICMGHAQPWMYERPNGKPLKKIEGDTNKIDTLEEQKRPPKKSKRNYHIFIDPSLLSLAINRDISMNLGYNKNMIRLQYGTFGDLKLFTSVNYYKIKAISYLNYRSLHDKTNFNYYLGIGFGYMEGANIIENTCGPAYWGTVCDKEHYSAPTIPLIAGVNLGEFLGFSLEAQAYLGKYPKTSIKAGLPLGLF